MRSCAFRVFCMLYLLYFYLILAKLYCFVMLLLTNLFVYGVLLHVMERRDERANLGNALPESSIGS